jgi:hypothetical protein
MKHFRAWELASYGDSKAPRLVNVDGISWVEGEAEQAHPKKLIGFRTHSGDYLVAPAGLLREALQLPEVDEVNK